MSDTEQVKLVMPVGCSASNHAAICSSASVEIAHKLNLSNEDSILVGDIISECIYRYLKLPRNENQLANKYLFRWETGEPRRPAKLPPTKTSWSERADE